MRTLFGIDSHTISPRSPGFHRCPYVHIPDRHVREQSRAARIFRLCHKRCPAVARTVDVDGVVPAPDIDVLDGDPADGGGHAEHPERRIAVLGKDPADHHILDRTTAEIEILQPLHGVVRVQGNEIVVGLTGRSGDVLDQPVVHVTAEMESVLIERRLFRGEADIPDRKMGTRAMRI